MPKLEMGPGVKQALTWVMILSSFAGGYYFGAKDQWGLATELAIVTEDQEVDLDIKQVKAKRAAMNDEIMKELKDAKLHDCANSRMSDLLRKRSE